MIKKHAEYRVIKRRYIPKEKFTNPEEYDDDNPIQVHISEYAKDTSHHCDVKNGNITIFSYLRFGSICPFCNEQVMMVD